MSAGSASQSSYPSRPYLKRESLLKDLKTKLAKGFLSTADQLAWVLRCEAGHAIDIACLRVGRLRICMPGEMLFVEYRWRPKDAT